MNNGWIGKADGGGSRGRGGLTGVKPFKPVAKELEGVSDEKRSRGEVALLRIIKSKVEEEMEKEDKVKKELLMKNTLPLSKGAGSFHIHRKIMKELGAMAVLGIRERPNLAQNLVTHRH